MEEAKDFADCIPEDIVKEIRKNGKEQDCQHVYRVAKRGIIDDIAFMGSYEETVLEKREFNKSLEEIGSYSTSCYRTVKFPEKFLKFLKASLFKRYPYPRIIEGYTICGLSQLTIERLPDNKEKDHVDWWIYKGSFGKLAQTFTYYEACEEGGAE